MKSYQSFTHRCIVTGATPVDLHHCWHRGCGGTDDEWNLMPLVRHLHSECHAIGLKKFSEKYKAVALWLEKNGWKYDPVLIKWFNYHRDRE